MCDKVNRKKSLISKKILRIRMIYLMFDMFYDHAQAMKSCEVDLSESDVARLVLRFDEDESMRIDIKKFIKFIRGRVCTDSMLCSVKLYYVVVCRAALFIL